MERLKLEVPLVGIKVLKDSQEGFEDTRVYQGVSFCDAVRLASLGEKMLVEPGSIEVCKWSPIVLGLAEPSTVFGSKLEPVMPQGVKGYFVAPLSGFEGKAEPDVVILRAGPEQMRALIGALGAGALSSEYRGQLARSALTENGLASGARIRAIVTVNRALARLRRWKAWDRFTRVAFKSKLVTRGFDALISRTSADMSICRNSTVIPFLADAVNISHFCTGGITWGQNPPDQLTAGFTPAAIRTVYDRLDFPGKTTIQ